MKRIKLYITTCLCVLMLLPISCSDSFLEQTNTQAVTEESLFKTEADLTLLINGIYDTFHDVDFMLKSLWYQANFLSQDFKNYGADTFFETYEVPTAFDALNVFWKRAYTGIARANSALPIIDRLLGEGAITSEAADRLKGQAIFLRGLFYYYLASDFGGVPLELNVVTDGHSPRNTQDEVFASVENDMRAAAELLPWQQDLDAEDIGRATKGAALAYLGDALMWQKKYGEAIEAYDQLVGKYELEEEFIDIHEYNNQNGKESIFEVQYIEGSDMSWNHTNDSHWITTFSMPEEVTNFGYAYVDPNLYQSFEAGDERKFPTVIGPDDEHPSPYINIEDYPKVIQDFGGINTCGTAAEPWKGSDGARSGFYGVKNWRDPNAYGNFGDPAYIFSGQNLILMRYGQVLISKAEALHHENRDAEALAIINDEIRFRAGLGDAVGTDVMEIILNEYRHELAGEFSLWFLLRRSGLHIKYVKDRYDIDVPPGKDLMPIPQAQVALNSNLEQNAGY